MLENGREKTPVRPSFDLAEFGSVIKTQKPAEGKRLWGVVKQRVARKWRLFRKLQPPGRR